VNFETSVKIERPVDEVFDYVSDPRNFPDWNSAVQAVRQTSPRTDGAATYSMVRELPDGRAENDLEVLASRRPSAVSQRAASLPPISSVRGTDGSSVASRRTLFSSKDCR